MGSIGRFLAVVAFMIVFKVGTKILQVRQENAKFNQAMKLMVTNLTKDLPTDIDEYTELYDVRYENETLFYTYNMINLENEKQSDIDAMKETFPDEQKATVLKHSCEGKRAELVNRINLDMTYLLDDESIAHVVVKKGSCKKSQT